MIRADWKLPAASGEVWRSTWSLKESRSAVTQSNALCAAFSYDLANKKPVQDYAGVAIRAICMSGLSVADQGVESGMAT